MGTTIQITIYEPKSKIKALDAIDDAFEQFDHVIKKFSRFDPESELSHLNKSQGKWFKVSKEFFMLIEKSLLASKESNYLFDPTIIDLLIAYGYDKSYDPGRIIRRTKTGSFKRELEHVMKNRPYPSEINMDKKNLSIFLQKKQRLDLGASGKGYAIDLARNALIKAGFKNFIVNAGGDVYVGEKGKKVALFDPRNPASPLGTIILKNKALAGSGSFAKKAGDFHHILNPGSGKAGNKVLQTYAIAPTALEADIYATVLFLMGRKGLELMQTKGFQSIIISDKEIYSEVVLLES